MKDTLYSMSHKLYSLKTSLEKYLSKRTNELFDLEDKINLYDLTNTYFEGRMQTHRLSRTPTFKKRTPLVQLCREAFVMRTMSVQFVPTPLVV